MTGAHDEKVIERALDFACEYLEQRGTQIDPTGPERDTAENIKTAFINYAYLELGYFRGSLGRWLKL